MHQIFRVLGCISLVSRGDGWKMLKSCVLPQGRAMSYGTFTCTFTIQNSAWINPTVTWDPVGIYIYIYIRCPGKKKGYFYIFVYTHIFFGIYVYILYVSPHRTFAHFFLKHQPTDQNWAIEIARRSWVFDGF